MATTERTVREMVREYLTAHGYDGLWSPIGECGCSLEDLMPCCSEGVEQCEAAYMLSADADSDYDFVMVPVLPKENG